MKRSRKIWGVVLSLMLLLSACSDSSQSDHSQADSSQTVSSQSDSSQTDSSSEKVDSKIGSAEERSEKFIENFNGVIKKLFCLNTGNHLFNIFAFNCSSKKFFDRFFRVCLGANERFILSAFFPFGSSHIEH